MLANLAFKSHLYRPSKSAIRGRTTELLTFKTVWRIHWRLSFEYLTTKNVVRGAAKGSKVRLEVELGAKPRIEDLFCLFILLSIGEGA